MPKVSKYQDLIPFPCALSNNSIRREEGYGYNEFDRFLALWLP